ncbi:LysE family translocator [Pelosinus propionicus]|uniref:Threonine/homoserine/homoserine lactone efflux protein n=1 Tax=Pelosinus propionicus DSM 13327 TaxID=1123291 RepID=A0A1I4PMB6_9FIRM|nr:LysE family transporter [Pelosinus propionicus]SFM28868.1 Threonine/homoserine/homoserine lactone efflux protein [Pelosinus propionicus DSM 13327]
MNITSFLLYCVIMTFTPGPTNVVILSTVQGFGIKKAMEYSYGATIAFGALLAISATLNTILVAVIPKILIVMQTIGTLYILYLAYQIYKMDTAGSTEEHVATFRSGFIMQFINPKVVLFTMTVIPSFVMPYYAEPHLLALFVAMITAIGFLAFVTWVIFGAMFKELLLKYQKLVNVSMSLFLIYSAIMGSGLVDLIRR